MDKSKKHSVNEYIRALMQSERFGAGIAFHRIIPAKKAILSNTRDVWHPEIKKLMAHLGIKTLFQHQAEAIDLIRSGKNVVTATPTASGKTLIYNLPVFEHIINDPQTRALYVFPLKALAQDQLRTIEKLAALPSGNKVCAAIYDGDTSAYKRKKIRDNPPNVLITNPEMVHLSLLPFHEKWSLFFKHLKFIIIDEVHTYRGIMGSHMAQVIRRLKRICNLYQSRPVFVFSSATIANPGELSNKLADVPVCTVERNSAPSGKKHIVFLDPVDGPVKTAIMLLRAALKRELRTIVYTQSRKLAELISIWAQNSQQDDAGRISAYRAGFLPEERREIENGLATGRLLAVISTSALELGIDIGDLDLCILVGYPGTIVSTLQRAGRVGRGGQDSALIMVAGEDALDRYFINNPDAFLTRKPEAAVINPFNREILSKHLECAAAELPLKTGEPFLADEKVNCVAHDLAARGELFISADGSTLYSKFKRPHRNVDLRGSGKRYTITAEDTGKILGQVDGHRAFRETHPGAIYLHKGRTHLVKHLDIDSAKVVTHQVETAFHTRVRAHKNTKILSIAKEKQVFGTRFFSGRIKVTEQVTGYDQIQTRTGAVLNRISLDLPPMVFETFGLWFLIPTHIQSAAEDEMLHFMGGIHAAEHAAIGVFPLLVMADRNDLGGISTPYHPQVQTAAIFLYDGIPGGAGLCEQAFEIAESLLTTTLEAIDSCTCETGCPSCVHSPKCGSGNRPIDKQAAIKILSYIIKAPSDTPPVKHHTVQVKNEASDIDDKALKSNKMPYFGVLDIETQKSAKEVGGWHRADLMRVSCAVLYDSEDDAFYEFVGGQIPMLVAHLEKLDLVVGFNIKRFDYKVLSGYTDFDFQQLPTLDLLEKVHNQLGYRLSLDHLAKATLNAKKTADGLAALKWWKQGKMKKIMDYCKQDVAITRDLYLFGKHQKYILFTNKAKMKVRLPVKW